jgi:hypothetical protein
LVGRAIQPVVAGEFGIDLGHDVLTSLLVLLIWCCSSAVAHLQLLICSCSSGDAHPGSIRSIAAST